MTQRAMLAMGITLGMLLIPGLKPWNETPERTASNWKPSLLDCRVEAASPFEWLNEEATVLGFNELYSGASPLGIQFSSKLKTLNGHRVKMTGFMAPPLKPTLAFFVLTKVPMAICPFCSTDANWPNDIVVVRLSKPVTALPYDQPIQVIGKLEVGSQIDQETGFVSLVRLNAERLERSKE